MPQTPPLSEILTHLLEILQLEKSRLMAGDYAGLDEIAEKKAFYSSGLDAYFADASVRTAMHPFVEQIRRIQKLAAQNETLLAAAKAGVSSAKTRLANIIGQERTVGAYTMTGEKLRAPDAGVTKCKLA